MVKSASKPTKPINILRGAIGQRKNWGAIRNALSIIKNQSGSSEFPRLYGLAAKNPMLSVAIVSSKKVTKSGLIQSIKSLETTTIEREFIWAATIIKPQSKLISQFSNLKEEYLRQLMSGNLIAAEETLNNIDNQCGKSLWSIENRIALQTQKIGFEATKNLILSITKGQQRSFYAFFSHQIGERNETRVSRSNYEQRLRDKIKTWKIDSGQEDYLLYKLAGVYPKQTKQVANIICYEGSSSPIDYYETIIDLLPTILEQQSKESRDWAQIITSLPIEDFRLKNIELIQIQNNINKDLEPKYLNEFLSGKFENSIYLVNQALQADPNDASALIIAAILLCQNCETPIKFPSSFTERIVKQTCEFLLHQSKSDEAAQELDKIALNYRYLPVSNYLESILAATSTDIVPAIPISTCIRTEKQNIATSAFQLSSIELCSHLDSIDRNTAFIQYLKNSRRPDNQKGPLAHLSTEATQYSEIHNSNIQEKYQISLEYIRLLKKSEYIYHKTNANILNTWILYESGDIEECILESVHLSVRNTVLLRSLPISKIFEKRGFRDLKAIKHRINLSIGFYLYRTLTKDQSKDVALKVAWKQFHEFHGAKRPSELKDSIAALPREELIFFLRFVCTQEVMEISSAFESPADLDKERLNICITLSGLDPENVNDYNSEIIELTRRQSIEDGVQQVESSRVYVDEIGIQRWCNQNLSESFLRYIDYTEAGLNASSQDLETAIVSILKRNGINTELVSFLDGYDVTSDSLLAELIEAVADAFLTLPRFGLDAFLGSRVRHGSLEGAFRNPLVNRHLITKIDSSTNQYESNEYWIRDINFKNKQQRNTIDRTLINFSKNFDQIIGNAINRLIHVKSKTHPDGLISLWPLDESTRRNLLKGWTISAKINLTKDATIDNFVDYCINTFFWPQLRYSLESASEYVNGTLSAQLQTELDHLRTSIRTLTDKIELLPTTIDTANAELRMAAQKVAKWFTPPQLAGASSSYLLKTGIEIGITSLRHIQPKFQPAVSWSVDKQADVLLHPHAFQIINDVSFLIFGNILQHSGHFNDIRVPQAEPEVHVNISWSEPNLIEVEVRNAISSKEDLEAIKISVEAAKRRIQQRAFDSVTKKTKNTGLVRLASTLNYEQSEERRIDFGVTEENEFRVFFSVPKPFLTGN